MLIFWEGRGWWITWIAALAMFGPIVALRQVDGPEIDRAVAVTMAVAGTVTLVLGVLWNRNGARHSFWGLPMPVWAAPMLLFAALLGTGTITTAEEAPPARRETGQRAK